MSSCFVLAAEAARWLGEGEIVRVEFNEDVFGFVGDGEVELEGGLGVAGADAAAIAAVDIRFPNGLIGAIQDLQMDRRRLAHWTHGVAPHGPRVGGCEVEFNGLIVGLEFADGDGAVSDGEGLIEFGLRVGDVEMVFGNLDEEVCDALEGGDAFADFFGDKELGAAIEEEFGLLHVHHVSVAAVIRRGDELIAGVVDGFGENGRTVGKSFDARVGDQGVIDVELFVVELFSGSGLEVAGFGAGDGAGEEGEARGGGDASLQAGFLLDDLDAVAALNHERVLRTELGEDFPEGLVMCGEGVGEMAVIVVGGPRAEADAGGSLKRMDDIGEGRVFDFEGDRWRIEGDLLVHFGDASGESGFDFVVGSFVEELLEFGAFGEGDVFEVSLGGGADFWVFVAEAVFEGAPVGGVVRGGG